MKRIAAVAFVLAVALAPGNETAAQGAPLEATTAQGEKVLLFPNGRWEYADRKKAEMQRENHQAEEARERGAQGGLFGIGRKIHPGDRDYNRGSLNPNRR